MEDNCKWEIGNLYACTSNVPNECPDQVWTLVSIQVHPNNGKEYNFRAYGEGRVRRIGTFTPWKYFTLQDK